MARRPQTAPRRGIARAVGAAVLLIVVLLVAILVTSSLTAPSAQAPTPPPTPGPITTPAPQVTGTPPRGTGATPGTKKTSQLLRPGSGSVAADLAETRTNLRRTYQGLKMVNATASPDGRDIAYFARVGDAYSQTPLEVVTYRGWKRTVGVGDSLVRPVWSPDARQILYARATETNSFPGTRWWLFRTNLRTGKTDVLAQHNGMALTPLGWWNGHPLYLVANTTDTSIFSVTQQGVRHVGILEPAPVISASLSPNGESIATSVPANCTFCTLHIYDMKLSTQWIGPSGLSSDVSFAWAQDGRHVATNIGNRLALINVAKGSVTYTSLPASLPRVWRDPLRAVTSGESIRLVDPVLHRVYAATL